MTQDTRVRTWTVVVTAMLAVMLALLCGLTPRNGNDGYFQTIDLLRQIKELDARAEAEVLRARVGIDSNYDAVTAALSDMQIVLGKFDADIAFGAGVEEASSLAVSWKALRATEADKSALIEHFKSVNSILRNSLAFLPTAEADVQSALKDLDEVAGQRFPGRNVAELSRRLFIASLINAQGASTDNADQIGRQAAGLALMKTKVPAPIAARIDVFLMHVRIALREQSTADDLVREIASLPTARGIDAIVDIVSAGQQSNANLLQFYRTCLLAFAGAVLMLFLAAATRLVATQKVLARSNNALQEANALLERRVDERTFELRQAQRELVASARKAGMAQIATNVLHNVGNVLNGVNVSVATIISRLRSSRLRGIGVAMAMMEKRSHDLAAVLSADERGRLLPAYLATAVRELEAEHGAILDESMALTRSVDHLKEIVAAQQDHVCDVHLFESVRAGELVDEALRLNAAALAERRITVRKAYAETPPCRIDRVRTLQILVNLIRNAAQAMESVENDERLLRLDVDTRDIGRLRVCIVDTGIGIARENLTRIFAHGYTTKPHGHGFGLHGAALAAGEMGGVIQVHSDGCGLGATFTLDLPVATGMEYT
ncbi:MAG: DAHL domain-containing protein [Burkholderiaceae bacterium]